MRRGNKYDRGTLCKRTAYYKGAQIAIGATGNYFFGAASYGIDSADTMVTGPTSMSMPNVSEFTTLWDKYKLLRVKWTFIPKWNSLEQPASGSAGNLLTLSYVHDVDDVTVPTDFNYISQYPGLVTKTFMKPMSVTMKYPCVSTAIYNSAVSTAYGVKKGPWINMAYSQVPHYGIKGVWSSNGNTTWYIDLKITWYFVVKNMR